MQTAWEPTWKGKTICLSNRIALENILRRVLACSLPTHTYIHVCVCIYIYNNIYTNYFKYIREGCCLKLCKGAGKWEVKFTLCSYSAGNEYFFFPILFLSFSPNPSGSSSGSLCRSSTGGIPLLFPVHTATHSLMNWTRRLGSWLLHNPHSCFKVVWSGGKMMPY